MTSRRAPKQRSLSLNETITLIEAWENNLKTILSLDPNFADFLTDRSSWGKKKQMLRLYVVSPMILNLFHWQEERLLLKR